MTGSPTLPHLVPVRRRFAADHVDDVGGTLRAELQRAGVRVQATERIAIAVGSRGITDLPILVRTMVDWVRQQGGRPFIVPAMGSHGGATADGQREVVAQYGITEDAVGAPVESSMDVVELPQGDAEVAVYMDARAHRADGTILVNRVKPHTSFHGRYESGLMKMCAIGLGKQRQAETLHRLGVRGLRDVMPRVARQVLHHGNVRLGVAVVENAYKKLLAIRAIPAAAIPDEEPALLDLARAHLPRLPADRLDVLIVDEIGKNISGLGLDPNVVGRLRIPGEPEPASPSIRVVTIHDLTPETSGNAIGMGLADIATRRLFEKIDFRHTYENAITSGFLERGKVPLLAASDREAVELAVRACGCADVGAVRVIRIRNTLRLDELQVSAAVLADLADRGDVEPVGPSRPIVDDAGRLTPW